METDLLDKIGERFRKLDPDFYLAFYKADLDRRLSLAYRIFDEYNDTEGLKLVGKASLDSKNPYIALEAYTKLNDRKGLKKVMDLAVKTNCLFDYIKACEKLKDIKGYERALKLDKEDGQGILGYAFYNLLGKLIRKDFERFHKEKGFEKVRGMGTNELHKIVNAAHELSLSYDIGVGVATAAMLPSYVFNLMNLPVAICKAHRKGSGATFEWCDDPEAIRQKNVLVIEHDVLSGRTLKRVADEVRKYNPKTLDLFLCITNPENPHLLNIPSCFGETLMPQDFDYKNFYQAYLKLKKKFK